MIQMLEVVPPPQEYTFPHILHLVPLVTRSATFHTGAGGFSFLKGICNTSSSSSSFASAGSPSPSPHVTLSDEDILAISSSSS